VIGDKERGFAREIVQFTVSICWNVAKTVAVTVGMSEPPSPL
jgi:hypothetical protein